LTEAMIMNDTAEINLYELTEAQLSFMFKQLDLVPKTGSPLGGCAQLEPEKIEQNFPLSEAIQCLTQPERVLAAATWPPDDAPVRWYYGRFDQPYLAQHEVSEDGRHLIVWPLPYAAVAEVISEPLLGYVEEVAAGEFKLTTNQDGMLLLAAMCDALQEQEINGFLQRAIADDSPLTKAALLGALQTSLGADDLRWSAARLSHMSPMVFPQEPDSMQRAIELFQQDHLLRPEEDGYRPTPPLAANCSRWNGADAFCAMTERRLGEDEDWDWQHQAFLHAAGGMFQFEFTNISKDGYGVSISEVAVVEVMDKIAALTAHEVVFQPTTADTAQAESHSCRSCGVILRPGNSFCTQCGTPVTPEESQVSEPTTPQVQKQSCSNCGNDLKADIKFCPQCGEKVTSELREA